MRMTRKLRQRLWQAQHLRFEVYVMTCVMTESPSWIRNQIPLCVFQVSYICNGYTNCETDCRLVMLAKSI